MSSKGPHRIVVVRRHEHHERLRGLANEAHHGETVEFGHLQIEHGEVWAERLDQADGRHAVLGFANDLHIRKATEQGHEVGPGWSFIIGQDDAETVLVHGDIDAVCAASSPVVRPSKGMRISTHVPSPPRRSRRTEAASP